MKKYTILLNLCHIISFEKSQFLPQVSQAELNILQIKALLRIILKNKSLVYIQVNVSPNTLTINRLGVNILPIMLDKGWNSLKLSTSI